MLTTTAENFAAETAETADAPAVPVPTAAPFKPTPELRKLGAGVLAECQRLHDLAQRLSPERVKEMVAEDIAAAGDDPDALLRISPLIVASENSTSRGAHAKAARSIVKQRIRDEAEKARALIISKAEHDLREAERVLAQYTDAEAAAQAAVGVTGAETSPVVMRLQLRRDANRARLEDWRSGELKVQWGELASLIG